MLKNQNIICISSIDWDFVWQGHQEIMLTFARNGNRVLFIENTGVRVPHFKDIHRLRKRVINWLKSTKGFRKEMENLYVYSPVILPFPYSRLTRWPNKHMLIRPIKTWMRVSNFHDPIIWTFLPTGIALDMINSIDNKLLVYYCIADFYELVDSSRKLKKIEDELIRRSDIIFVQGKVLYEKCRQLNDNVHIFPFGVNIDIFDSSPHFAEIPLELKNIKKPIIGYIGGVHRHIDFDLLKFIAESRSDWSIVLIGPLQTDIYKIKGLSNVFLLGKKDFSLLPYYINNFDVCIIPYVKNEYTATVYPTKLNEYFALGKPVVATDLPEIINFNARNDNLVLIAKTYEEFINYIDKAINNTDDELAQKRISSAKKNSWATRIEMMATLIEKTIDKKDKRVLNWQENLLRLYRASRRKVLKQVFIFLSIYIFIFYTPLVWFLANPLKISQLPQKADCIIVFAGGVGESGKATQGYEERVQYAVDLYKKEYARFIVFSSGYMYVFKEPLIMKALAEYLGVPGKAIILEDRAGNTYENVKFSKTILEKNSWKKALLISSPYHMLRVSLVVQRIARELEVIYTPVPNSSFYDHPEKDSYGKKIWKRISLKQIKGIIHEYLGIIYYWWKGYI